MRGECNLIVVLHRVARERAHVGGISPCPFIRGETGAKVPFYKIIMEKFMVYPERIEANLLQLSAHP